MKPDAFLFLPPSRHAFKVLQGEVQALKSAVGVVARDVADLRADMLEGQAKAERELATFRGEVNTEIAAQRASLTATQWAIGLMFAAAMGGVGYLANRLDKRMDRLEDAVQGLYQRFDALTATVASLKRSSAERPSSDPDDEDEEGASPR